MADFDYVELMQSLKEQILDSLSVSRIAKVLFTVVICLVAVKFLNQLTDRLLKNSHFSSKFQWHTSRSIKVTLWLAATLVIAASLGIPVDSLVYLIGMIGLVLYLAAQDILSNVAGGLVILFAKPFLVNDYIETDIGTGTVAAIETFYTKLITYEGQQISVPNSKLSSSKIINYTRLGTRRIDIPFYAPYNVPAATVRGVCLRAMAASINLLKDPQPTVTISEFGDRAVQYYVRCWVKVDVYWDSKFALMEQMKKHMEDAGIALSYNHMDVNIKAH